MSSNSSSQQHRIHRHGYQRDFTVMPNALVENPRLSWAAKGLFWYILSRPIDWVLYRSQLASVYTGDKRGNGSDAVDSIFNELIDNGYIVYTAKDPDTGRFIHRYDAYPEPQEIQKSNPKPVKPCAASTPNGLNPPQPNTYSIPSNERTVRQGKTPLDERGDDLGGLAGCSDMKEDADTGADEEEDQDAYYRKRLVEFGCDEGFVREILDKRKIPYDVIREAGNFVSRKVQRQKGEISNVGAYFRETLRSYVLKNGLKWPSVARSCHQ